MTNQEEIQNAIEWIEGLRNGWNDEDNIKYCNMAIKALEHEQRWIPVSERLPEEGQEVLCQCQAGIIDVFTWSKSVGWIENDTNAYMPLFVVAWRYLPEPYKAESNLDGDPIDIDKAIEHYEGTLETLKDIDLEDNV